jgi:hypothetical protein
MIKDGASVAAMGVQLLGGGPRVCYRDVVQMVMAAFS